MMMMMTMTLHCRGSRQRRLYQRVRRSIPSAETNQQLYQSLACECCGTTVSGRHDETGMDLDLAWP